VTSIWGDENLGCLRLSNLLRVSRAGSGEQRLAAGAASACCPPLHACGRRGPEGSASAAERECNFSRKVARQLASAILDADRQISQKAGEQKSRPAPLPAGHTVPLAPSRGSVRVARGCLQRNGAALGRRPRSPARQRQFAPAAGFARSAFLMAEFHDGCRRRFRPSAEASHRGTQPKPFCRRRVGRARASDPPKGSPRCEQVESGHGTARGGKPPWPSYQTLPARRTCPCAQIQL